MLIFPPAEMKDFPKSIRYGMKNSIFSKVIHLIIRFAFFIVHFKILFFVPPSHVRVSRQVERMDWNMDPLFIHRFKLK